MRRKSTAATTGSRAWCCARSSCGSGRTPPDPFFGNASNLPQRLPARPEIAEQIGRHLAHLNLFRALCDAVRSEEHTSELQSLMRISYAVFCLKKKTHKHNNEQNKRRI